jgi:predicted HTH transcriptional regulator
VPLSDDELRSLAGKLEPDLVERKESFGDSDKVAQAVCAFANDLPDHGQAGVILIGLKDDGMDLPRSSGQQSAWVSSVVVVVVDVLLDVAG